VLAFHVELVDFYYVWSDARYAWRGLHAQMTGLVFLQSLRSYILDTVICFSAIDVNNAESLLIPL
jgi:hypothetical protein